MQDMGKRELYLSHTWPAHCVIILCNKQIIVIKEWCLWAWKILNRGASFPVGQRWESCCLFHGTADLCELKTSICWLLCLQMISIVKNEHCTPSFLAWNRRGLPFIFFLFSCLFFFQQNVLTVELRWTDVSNFCVLLLTLTALLQKIKP